MLLGGPPAIGSQCFKRHAEISTSTSMLSQRGLTLRQPSHWPASIFHSAQRGCHRGNRIFAHDAQYHFVAPGVHIHQRLDGRIVLGEQDGAPDTAAHKQRLASYPTRFPSEDAAQQRKQTHRNGTAVLTVIASRHRCGGGGYRLASASSMAIRLWSQPAAANSYIAIMHSGVSLGPVVGEMVSDELINGTSRTELSPYRASRDFRRIKRY